MEKSEIAPAKAELVPWLNENLEFYSIPGGFALSRSRAFQSGRVYGMDVSSGAAVAALLSTDYDDDKDDDENDQLDDTRAKQPISGALRVLDLCCAPGLKLCMIADLVAKESTVVGVDIDDNRLAVCRNIVTKYHVDSDTSGNPSSSSSLGVRIQLHRGDGVHFGTADDSSSSKSELMYDSVVAQEECLVTGTRKRRNKSARAREKKRLKQLNGTTTGTACSFDMVLVDAECSTDGSIKHIQQQAAKKDRIDNSQLTKASELKGLVELQQGLILSGFRHLKPGGVMVYSTCSLSLAQNESVVQWLLAQAPDAVLRPVRFSHPCTHDLVVEGTLRGTVRFRPSFAAATTTNTTTTTTGGGGDGRFAGGGFFLAKIVKKADWKQAFAASVAKC